MDKKYLDHILDGASGAAGDNSFRIGRHVFVGVAFAVLLVGGVGGWAMTAELSGAVIAQGSVKVDRNLRVIQHRDGGIVSEIAVREGDRVAQGQVLLRLDDVQTRAELSIVRAQLAELAIRKARLIAERDGVEALDLPVLVGQDDHVRLILRGETRLLEGNIRNRKTQKEQLTLSIEQLEEEIRGLEAQRVSTKRESGLAEIEHTKIKGLADRQLVDGTRLYTSDRELARLSGEMGATEASIARAKAKISEVRLQIISVDETARTDAQRELSLIDPKLAELKERGNAIDDRLARTDIRSPIAGTVNEITVNTLGGIISPAEKLITLVPDNADLKVEARLAVTDIDQVFVGQAARLRFSAFNQRVTPELKGVVVYVSPATTVDQASGEPRYLAEIKLNPTEAEKLGSNELRPGMPIEVFISTERRTALSYLAKPLTDQFSRAMRED